MQSTNHANSTDIIFSVIKNYFVNKSNINLDNPKIETKHQFDKIFGVPAAMGNEGKPTEIDFAKNYVIAVEKPETDEETQIEPVNLQKDDKRAITLTYKLVVGSKKSFTTSPFLAIVVNKAENGVITLKEIVQ